MGKIVVVILAAGEGTRMKSGIPKVLHKVAGRSMLRWVLSRAFSLNPEKVFVVIGHKKELLKKDLAGEKAGIIEQSKQLGSGHALKQAERHLKGYRGDILVLCGDIPLIREETLKKLIRVHRQKGNAATILSAKVRTPFGYGRIRRGHSGEVLGIAEEGDASAKEKRIKEVNSGIYCFSSPDIWEALGRIRADNVKKEYYLTDTVSILRKYGKKVGASCHAVPEEIIGVNSKADLEAAEKIVNKGRISSNN